MPARVVMFLKVLVHVLCLLPLMYLLERYRSDAVASMDDPVSWTTHFTGHWALFLLLADLAITPLRRLHRTLAPLVRLRRMVGLYAFFYATLHLLTYVFLFSGYDLSSATGGVRGGHWGEPWRQLVAVWPAIWDDLSKRRFLAAGLAAWTMLLLLALTSPHRVLRWMGGKKWQRLHRLVYLAGFAAIVHLWWQMKKGDPTPWKPTVVLLALLAARLALVARKRLGSARQALARI